MVEVKSRDATTFEIGAAGEPWVGVPDKMQIESQESFGVGPTRAGRHEMSDILRNQEAK